MSRTWFVIPQPLLTAMKLSVGCGMRRNRKKRPHSSTIPLPFGQKRLLISSGPPFLQKHTMGIWVGLGATAHRLSNDWKCTTRRKVASAAAKQNSAPSLNDPSLEVVFDSKSPIERIIHKLILSGKVLMLARIQLCSSSIISTVSSQSHTDPLTPSKIQESHLIP